MDVATYADLAVRLVNTTGRGRERGDGLSTDDSYRRLVADRPYLAQRVTAGDLEALRLLREELRLVFTAVSRGDHDGAIERLNALLTRYPLHPEITSHDGKGWHVHLVESGSAADKYAAGAIAGLTGIIAGLGVERCGVCAGGGCGRAFIDTSPAGGRRYCSDRCAAKASVRPLRTRDPGPSPAPTAASG